VLLGKENMEEFAAGATSNNPHFGPVRNPWATEHVPGGSSGGGGANVATEVTFASLGTDLGGSVRLPGSFCGVVGLKQTFGRVSQRGLLVTSFNGDHIGPMTRSVADSAIMLQALAGHDPLDPSSVPVPVPDYSAALGRSIRGLRMGVPSNYFFEELDPEVEEATRRAVAALEELGAVSVPVELPMMKYIGAVRMAAMADSVVTHEPFLRANREDYGPDVLYRTLGGQFVLGHHYSKAMKAQRLIQEDYARAFQNVDFIVTPTTPTCAPRIDTPYIEHAGEMHRVRGPGSGLVSRNTSPLNSTGHPAITVPCGLNSGGLPIGLQFIAAGFREEVLFQVAAAYEQVSPTQGRRPPVLEG
jgi:aspartyl-tRNA(Asn)/glutamyl-tRNA(Gln) amidotransferase subunit A